MNSVPLKRRGLFTELQQYRRYQWLTATHGQLADTVPSAAPGDRPVRDEFNPSDLKENVDIVFDRLLTTQESLEETFREIDLKLLNKFRGKKRKIFVDAGLKALFVSAFVTWLLNVLCPGHLPACSWMLFIPFMPSFFVVWKIAAHEKHILGVEITRGRVGDMRSSIASLHPVTVADVIWIGGEEYVPGFDD
ncbi:hypothetical protein DM02DRAFT_659537 [Periconia macrospinosa]|uniref:Uncharacterized protein n=1 Tax=Periconia macrospinosa TaxID=97972 RepID=A0A2V1DDJ6_9PLEO|nr:hypothetical protein DM02DRAFT_659537 [Periconia macrospinosa]